MSGVKLNAEYFIEEMEASSPKKPAFFEFKYNPFRYDINGKRLEIDATIKLPREIWLKPDMDTLREVSWLKKEAMVMADLYTP